MHLVGHDWGAVVAWYAAANFPEQMRTLTALSVPHTAAFLRSMPGRQGLKSWYMLLFNLPRLPERLARRPGGVDGPDARRQGGMRPEDVARFRREIVDAGRPHRRPELVPRHARSGSVTAPARSRSRRRTCGATTTARSPARPRAVAPGTAPAPTSSSSSPGVSHWTPRHAPDAVADAILARIAA